MEVDFCPIGIMRAFVEMRRFIANNALLFERISNVELKQLEYQKKTDEKLEQIFEYISDHEESNQKIFFDGQIYDAFSLLIGLIMRELLQSSQIICNMWRNLQKLEDYIPI